VKKLVFLSFILASQFIFSMNDDGFVSLGKDDAFEANRAAFGEYAAKGYLDELSEATSYNLGLRLAEIEKDKQAAQLAKNIEAVTFLKFAEQSIKAEVEGRPYLVGTAIAAGSSAVSSAIDNLFGYGSYSK
jgi:hypothetical protein